MCVASQKNLESMQQKLTTYSIKTYHGEYDEYYVNDIVDTIKIIENVLTTTDFETQVVFYVSSW